MEENRWMRKKLINGRNFWLNITRNMETVEEILIYFWTMSENRSECWWREKKSGFRASLRELKSFLRKKWYRYIQTYWLTPKHCYFLVCLFIGKWKDIWAFKRRIECPCTTTCCSTPLNNGVTLHCKPLQLEYMFPTTQKLLHNFQLTNAIWTSFSAVGNYQ